MGNKINKRVTNSRVSIQGKDIVLDYEFELHGYLNEVELKEEGLVPVEMYPYEGDILIGYIHVDDEFGVIDLQELYDWAIEAIKNENIEL
jgi:hypothetical protein